MLTPQKTAENLGKNLGLNTPLYLKREDLHPLGSHKGRSIPKMIDRYIQQGVTNFVISSSGNAALAATITIKEYNKKLKKNLSLTIFVGEKIDQNKLEALNNVIAQSEGAPARLGREAISFIQVPNPKQQAFQMDKSGQAKNLRQSTDDLALAGYEELASEILDGCHSREGGNPKLSAVFIPTSSGTTAEGLYNGFKKLGNNPQIHIVQTTACHPIADTVIARSEATKQSPANEVATTASFASAIVDKVALRKNSVAKAIENSHGSGWIATNDDIKQAIDLVKKTEQFSISPNSALSVAGLIHAINSGQHFDGPIVCLLTGK